MTKQRQNKLLIIGSTQFNFVQDEVRVESIPWYKANLIRNIRDYDIVVFDLLNPSDVVSLPAHVTGSFFVQSHCRELLTTGGLLIVLGDPRTAVASHTSNDAFWGRTGFTFSFDEAGGDTLMVDQKIPDGLAKYLGRVKQWEYAFRSFQVPQFPHSDPNDFVWSVRHRTLAWNRSHHSLALEFRMVLEAKTQYGTWAEYGESGVLLLLPENSMQHEEAILCVLRDICNIRTSLPEPGWAKSILIPGQEVVTSNISVLEGRMQVLHEEIDRETRKLSEIRKVARLLFDVGDSLEEIVRYVLGELGAQVEIPPQKGRCDGYLTVRTETRTYHGVLEVKGTKNDQFSLEGLRQLSDWIQDAAEDKGIEHKGIFIGSHCVDVPPPERRNAFPENWQKTARTRKMAGLTTSDLFRVYVEFLKGNAARDVFWDTLFKTDGVFNAEMILVRQESSCAQQGIA